MDYLLTNNNLLWHTCLEYDYTLSHSYTYCVPSYVCLDAASALWVLPQQGDLCCQWPDLRRWPWWGQDVNPSPSSRRLASHHWCQHWAAQQRQTHKDTRSILESNKNTWNSTPKLTCYNWVQDLLKCCIVEFIIMMWVVSLLRYLQCNCTMKIMMNTK